MELTYTQVGDYLLPDLKAPQAPTLGKYGMLRRSFLREHRQAIYNGMLLSETLNSHLTETDRAAEQMMEQLTNEMATAEGVTEQLKASDQMTWVRRMNNIRQRAEEIVMTTLLYT